MMQLKEIIETKFPILSKGYQTCDDLHNMYFSYLFLIFPLCSLSFTFLTMPVWMASPGVKQYKISVVVLDIEFY